MFECKKHNYKSSVNEECPFCAIEQGKFAPPANLRVAATQAKLKKALSEEKKDL